MKRTLLVTGALAASALSLFGCKRNQEAAAPVAPGKPEYCAVAEAYLTDRLGRFANKEAIVVTDAAPATSALLNASVADFTHAFNPGEENPYGWPKDPPSAALAQAWLAVTPSNALAACEGLGEVVTAAGVELLTGDAATRAPRGNDTRLRIAIALPMVTEAQDEALLLEVGRVAGGGGADAAVHLRKGPDGAWKETDNRVFIPNFEFPTIPDVPPPVPPPAKKTR